jgi:hypothetical protein
MAFKYFNNKKWSEISRDERFFCSHLYFELRKNPSPLLNHLYTLGIIKQNDIFSEMWEVAFEVCFYRDFIFNLGYKGNTKIGSTAYKEFLKRTFDLCLFSESHIIIIEAKAQGGFGLTQLKSITNDISLIKEIVEDTCEVSLIGLASSKYKPRKTTKTVFSEIISWKTLFEWYQDPLFLRADDTFRK